MGRPTGHGPRRLVGILGLDREQVRHHLENGGGMRSHQMLTPKTPAADVVVSDHRRAPARAMRIAAIRMPGRGRSWTKEIPFEHKPPTRSLIFDPLDE
jgi:hypothetical protein